MTRFFDSHSHFDRKDGDEGYDATVRRAIDVGTERIMAIGGSHGLNSAALKVTADHPDQVRAAIGFDRDQSSEFARGDGAINRIKIESHLDTRSDIMAIGEVGLDYHYLPESAREQRFLFESQLEIARGRQLPIVVHSRDADEDTASVLAHHADHWQGSPERMGVLHCYTGNETFAKQLLDLGLYISFSGIATFKNAEMLRGVAAMVPDARILIETDSPYLAPVPLRGKRNEPAYVTHVAEVIANVRGQSVEDIARITWDNASRLFGWE